MARTFPSGDRSANWTLVLDMSARNRTFLVAVSMMVAASRVSTSSDFPLGVNDRDSTYCPSNGNSANVLSAKLHRARDGCLLFESFLITSHAPSGENHN